MSGQLQFQVYMTKAQWVSWWRVERFCRKLASREGVGVKRSIVLNHVNSTEHIKSKKRLLQKEAIEVDIVVAMKQYDDATYSSHSTVVLCI